jgi:two-component system nitrate/nitrite response regulator NarL
MSATPVPVCADAIRDAIPGALDRRISVLVADDHPAMRRALARLVSDDEAFELVAEAVDGDNALELIEELRPDVALLDVRMPGHDGLELLRALTARGSRVRVLLISGYEDGAIAHQAISLGAAGFLSKDSEEDEIRTAILDVSRGRSVLSRSLQSAVLDQIRQREPARAPLSGRERELLELAAGGASNAEIAQRLCLSPNTIKTYWQRLYEKLGASDRSGAIAEALRTGLVR